MKKVNMNQSKFSKFISGKGFYVSLVACVTVVGAAAFITYKQTAEKLKNQLQQMPQQTSVTDYDYYDEIENANAEKDNEPKETTTTTEETTAQTTEQTVAVTKQPFLNPVNGEILNDYSFGNLVKSQTLNCWITHDGIDIKADCGTQVKAMTSGKITDIYEDANWGNCMVIDHGNGIVGYYFGLNKELPVQVGEVVCAGTIIGAVGEISCECAESPHLHFGIKKDGQWDNPYNYIKK